ncbi:MAG: ribonuclease HII [Fidelibacterota bacterium]
MSILAGVDEAGRGPIAGPVVAAAVILSRGLVIPGVRDSKLVTENRRERLYDDILDGAVAVGTGIVHENQIDRSNVLSATFRAMKMALARLRPQPSEAIIDGHPLPDQVIPNRGVIRGDEKVHSISAASIVAKVTRDRIMRMYHTVYPEYGFHRHKGYATRDHLQNLSLHGACPIHRKSFRPVKKHLLTLGYLKKRKLLGQWGERVAATRLIHKGYRILEMNYQAAPYGEIDVVARNNATVVFVEVKTVTQGRTGAPGQNMDARKIRRLADAFDVYTHEKGGSQECRFDLMTVFLSRGGPVIRHYEDCLN